MDRRELEAIASEQGRPWLSTTTDAELRAMIRRPLWKPEQERVMRKECLGLYWDKECDACAGCVDFHRCQLELATVTIPQRQAAGKSLDEIAIDLQLPKEALAAALAACTAVVSESVEEETMEPVVSEETVEPENPVVEAPPVVKPKGKAKSPPKAKSRGRAKPKPRAPEKSKPRVQDKPEKVEKAENTEKSGTQRNPTGTGSAQRVSGPGSAKGPKKKSASNATEQVGRIRPWSQDTWDRRWHRERERNPWVGMLHPGEHVYRRHRSGKEVTVIVRQGYYEVRDRPGQRWPTLGAVIMELEGGKVYPVAGETRLRRINNWSADRYFGLRLLAQDLQRLAVVEELYRKLGKSMPRLPARRRR